MPLPDKQIFQAAIDTALAEAEAIIVKTKADPKAYVRPDIGNWGGRWVSSRYNNVLNTQDRGRLDLMEQQAAGAILGDTGMKFPEPTKSDLTIIGAGASANAEAAVTKLLDIKNALSKDKVDGAYKAYVDTLASGNKQGAFDIGFGIFRTTLLYFMTLYNTMLNHMDQGEKPMPVPGPGEHLEQSIFGDWHIVKDPPAVMPTDLTYLGNITVGQLRLILKSEK